MYCSLTVLVTAGQAQWTAEEKMQIRRMRI